MRNRDNQRDQYRGYEGGYQDNYGGRYGREEAYGNYDQEAHNYGNFGNEYGFENQPPYGQGFGARDTYGRNYGREMRGNYDRGDNRNFFERVGSRVRDAWDNLTGNDEDRDQEYTRRNRSGRPYETNRYGNERFGRTESYGGANYGGSYGDRRQGSYRDDYNQYGESLRQNWRSGAPSGRYEENNSIGQGNYGFENQGYGRQMRGIQSDYNPQRYENQGWQGNNDSYGEYGSRDEFGSASNYRGTRGALQGRSGRNNRANQGWEATRRQSGGRSWHPENSDWDY